MGARNRCIMGHHRTVTQRSYATYLTRLVWCHVPTGGVCGPSTRGRMLKHLPCLGERSTWNLWVSPCTRGACWLRTIWQTRPPAFRTRKPLVWNTSCMEHVTHHSFEPGAPHPGFVGRQPAAPTPITLCANVPHST